MEKPSSKPARAGERPPAPERDVVEPQPPRGWAKKLLFIFPAALFVFLMAVLLWGILSDLLAGYR